MSDVWDQANNTTEESVKASQSRDIWGQVRLDIWACALVKGTGKVPFDPAIHQRQSVAIDLFVDPIPEMGLTFSMERHMVDFEPDWYKFTKPSALECEGHVGHIRELPNKFVRAVNAETGETYLDKKTMVNGQPVVKNKTAIKFLKIFENEDACRADYLTSDRAKVNTPMETPVQPAPNGDGSTKEKEAALAFLKVIVQNAARGQEDIGVVRQTVAANIGNYQTTVAKFFTVDSPETVDLIKVAMPPF